MLLLVLALLSSAALCSSSPLPPATDTLRTAVVDCSASSLIQEALSDIQKLNGIPEMTSLNDVAEPEDNAFAYLERCIQVLENSKLSVEGITQKLQSIYAARNSCDGWMKHDWELMERKNFLENLDYLLRFLNQNAYSEKTV